MCCLCKLLYCTTDYSRPSLRIPPLAIRCCPCTPRTRTEADPSPLNRLHCHLQLLRKKGEEGKRRRARHCIGVSKLVRFFHPRPLAALDCLCNLQVTDGESLQSVACRFPPLFFFLFFPVSVYTQRCSYLVRRNCNFEATSQPPPTIKKAQYTSDISSGPYCTFFALSGGWEVASKLQFHLTR